jgi:hypothetical protein
VTAAKSAVQPWENWNIKGTGAARGAETSAATTDDGDTPGTPKGNSGMEVSTPLPGFTEKPRMPTNVHESNSFRLLEDSRHVGSMATRKRWTPRRRAA